MKTSRSAWKARHNAERWAEHRRLMNRWRKMRGRTNRRVARRLYDKRSHLVGLVVTLLVTAAALLILARIFGS